ncbi:MAG TPA: MraY family glycosyltransferase [Candidatus Krumholzibacteria bacterium]|nr:MraY family glycosyltransferase [Candidatus Krumholzibacteria bacterium]HPD71747.1 MraY family glycosyltransferase [Candidatus Krumholzibacteria bacterium]HRY41320.1 MraY family glycosyltransferase [Candidatus Krumholzibacteria bacterium]
MERGIVPLVSFGVAFVMSWLVQPHFRNLGFLTEIVDHPGGRRPHREPVPRTGGMAIFISFFCALYFLENFVLRMALPWPWLMILIGAGLVILALGVGDDRFGIHAEKKLYGQLIIILGLMLLGQRFESVTLPGLGRVELGGWSWPFTLFWYLGFINSMNLIDGLDGLASGISVLASLFLAVLALAAGEATSALLATTLAGSTMAFLYWNVSSRKIFLGDSGSMWMGLVLATLMLNLSRNAAVPLPVLLAPMTVPIWDTATTIVRRYRQRTSIFQADDNHLHHRLVRLGFSPARAVAALLLVTGGSGLFALSDFLDSAWLGLPAMAAWMGAAQLGALQHLRNRHTGWDLFSEVSYALGFDDGLVDRTGLVDRRVAEVIDLQAARGPLRPVQKVAGGELAIIPDDDEGVAKSRPARMSEGADANVVFPTSRDLH